MREVYGNCLPGCPAPPLRGFRQTRFELNPKPFFNRGKRVTSARNVRVKCNGCGAITKSIIGKEITTELFTLKVEEWCLIEIDQPTRLNHPACWDVTGVARESRVKAELIRDGLYDDQWKLLESNGMYHVSAFGTIPVSAVPYYASLGNRQVDALPAVFDPVTVATTVAVEEWMLPFGEEAVHAAVSSIDWTSLSLPLALQHSLEAILAASTSVADVLHAVATGGWAVPLVLPALRLYAYYTQVLNPDHTPRRTYSGSQYKIYNLPQIASGDEILLPALRAFAEFGGDMTRSAIDPSLYTAKQSLRAFNDEDAGQRAILNLATAQATEIAAARGKPPLYLGTDVGEVTAGLLARRLPEFAVKMISSRHTHGALMSTRHAFCALAAREAARYSDSPIRLVGARDAQVARFGNVTHNDAPVLSGRDQFRHFMVTSKVDRDHAAYVNHRCTFQDCKVKTPGATIIAPYCANDISAEDFLMNMIQKGCHRAFVVMHLPIPMLDKRVTTYRDVHNAVHYERHGKQLRMYLTNGAAAGYVNDFDTTMSWCRPLPTIPGFHVQVEEYRSFGTVFLLEVRVGLGAQELTPTMWRVTQDQFYVLPLIVPKWREPEERWFVVPRDRFENIVEFAMYPGTKNDLDNVLNQKIRGQQAEIKIGGHVIEPRWVMDIDEFNAVKMHAKVAASMRKLDLKQSESAWSNHMGLVYARHGVFGRPLQYLAYIYSLFTCQLTGANSPWANTADGWFTKYMLGTKFDHTQAWDFYSPAGEYRVINEANLAKLPSFARDWAEIGASFLGMSEWFVNNYLIKKPLSARVFNPPRFTSDEQVMPQADEQVEAAPSTAPSTELSIIPRSESVIPEPDEIISSETGSVAGVREQDEQAREIPEEPVEPPTVSKLIIELPDIDPTTDSVFDPEGPLQPTEPMSQCSAEFWKKPIFEPSDVVPGEIIFAPDSGLLNLIETVIRYDYDPPVTRDLSMELQSTIRHTDAPVTNELEQLIHDFFELGRGLKDIAVPKLVLNGVAGSAKSSVVRLFLKRQRIHGALVVTPSRKLAQEWRSKGDFYTVVTQHHGRRILAGFEWLVIDEFFSLDFDTTLVWLALAKKFNAKVIVLGEQNQRYTAGSNFPMDLVYDLGCPHIMLGVSNTIPVDAAIIVKHLIGNVGPMARFQTRSKRFRSIEIADAPEYDKLDRSMNFTPVVVRTTDGKPPFQASISGIESISQVQGMRADNVCLLLNGMIGQCDWLRRNVNQMYIALSRHSKRLMIFAPPRTFEFITGFNSETRVVVNGNYGKRPGNEPVSTMDTLLVSKYLPTDNPMLLGLQDDIDYVDRIERVNVIEDPWTPDQELLQPVPKEMIIDIVARHSQHDHIFDHDHALNMVIPVAGSLYSLSSVIEIKASNNPRSDIIGADKLAVHQSGANTFDDLRNVALRQTSVKPSGQPFTQSIAEAKLVFDLFRKAYYKPEYVTYPLLSAPGEWLNSRSASYFAKLWNELSVHLEAGATTRHEAFLKTQDKVKAESGFSSSLTHGQTVIASSPSYNAWAGPRAKALPYRIRDRLRDDVILDVGLSDRDLGRVLRDTGIGAKFHEDNVQIDISRQDSSHSAVSLLVFAAIMSDCGLDDDFINFYIERRSQYSFKSMHPGLYQGSLRFNLPSGDPFTLVCNIIHAMSATCERFDVRGLSCIHKGDDEIYAARVLKPRSGYVVADLRSVQFKMLTGYAPYHAGRFLLKDDVFVDPVRRFLKHFARSDNPNVSNYELYLAALDWQMRLTEDNVRWVKHACAQLYTDFTLEEIEVMIYTCGNLRDWKYFSSLYPAASDLAERGFRVFEADEDCAVAVAMHVIPGRDADFYAQFRDKDARELAALYSKYVRVPVRRHSEVRDKRELSPGIHIERHHVYYIY